MKNTRMSWATLGLGALLLAACSGGGGGGGTKAAGNTLTLTTSDAAGTTVTVAANDSNAVMSAHLGTAENKTIVQVCADLDKDNDCSHLVVMMIDGTTAATYSMASADSLTQITFHDDEAETGVLSHYLSSDGQVTLTEVGSAVGERVKGTYSATLTCNSGCSGNLTASGSFDVALSE